MTDHSELTGDTKAIHCTPCPMCGKQAVVMVRTEDYEKWRAGAHIQTAFPEMPDSDRELLMTGIDSACWDEMWGDEDG